MLTLWDLISPVLRPKQPAKRAKTLVDVKPAAKRGHSRDSVGKAKSGTATRSASPGAMQAKYDAVVEEMLSTHGVRVRKWRSGMSGIAWYVTYKDGRVVRLIESPRPKGPMSVAVFLHEIGHHAIGFDRYKPRCLEEYHAWAWSLRTMEEKGLNITEGVRRRMHASLWYAVEKAKRRGIRSIPAELEPFMERPPRRR